MDCCKSLRHKLQTASQLRLSDWLILAEAWLALLAADLALRLDPGSNGLKTGPDAQIEGFSASQEVFQAALRLQRLVGWAAMFHWLPMTCLRRALALRWMLARRAIPSVLRLGIHKQSPQFQAHAWLEVGGKPLGEPGTLAERFWLLSPLP